MSNQLPRILGNGAVAQDRAVPWAPFRDLMGFVPFIIFAHTTVSTMTSAATKTATKSRFRFPAIAQNRWMCPSRTAS
jgi:hypothetical protein